MGRAVKLLKRLTEIEKEYNQINELAKSSKYLLFIDRNISNINAGLADLGYDSEVVTEFLNFPRPERDFQTHRWLNDKRKKVKTKPIVFITNDYDDFLKFKERKYTIFGIKQNTDKKAINRIIESLRTLNLADDTVHKISGD